MVSAFVVGCPLLPVRAGELQCRALGAAVDAFDEQGRSVVDETGELVITQPMPSMPVFLWNDPDFSRYRASYFDMYPGVWRHGDWIRLTLARQRRNPGPLRFDAESPRRPRRHERGVQRGREPARDSRQSGFRYRIT